MTYREGYRRTNFSSIEQEGLLRLPAGCWKLHVHHVSYSVIR